jgi:SMODS-associating 2TM, beta-strand rich effector domain
MTSPDKFAERIVLVVTTLYTVAFFLTHQTIPNDTSKLVAAFPTVLGYGLLVFNRWAWRWPLIHRFVGRPRIDGTWVGKLQVSAESKLPESASREERDVALVIEQTYFSVGVTTLTKESASQSTSTSLRADADSSNRKVLAYTYLNVPKQQHRERSPQHSGASRMHIVGREPQTIEGTYWTDRYTAGDMSFTLVDRDLNRESFDAAMAAAAEAATPKKKQP